MDPLNSLPMIPASPVPVQAAKPVTTSVPMDVPEDDAWIYRQIRERSAAVTNLEEEITMLRYYRTKMQESIHVHSHQAMHEFKSRLLDALFKRLNYSISRGEIDGSSQHFIMTWLSESVDQEVKRHFPEWDIGPKELKALQDNILTTGKVAEQSKKIVDGMTINVNTNNIEEVITWLMQTVIMPCIPMEYHVNIENALLQFAPHFGGAIEEDIGG